MVNSLHAWYFFMFLLSSADFFQYFFKIFFQKHYQSVKQFGSPSGPTLLSVLTWVQTDCKGYLQITMVAASKVRALKYHYDKQTAKIMITVNLEIFTRVLFSWIFEYAKFCEVKTLAKSLLSFTDIGISCPSRKFLTSQICILMLFAKIRFSRKFPNLQ